MSNDDYAKLGATFIPGGFDDYYYPPVVDVVSPAPQRFTPEVPDNIQNNLAALELDANQSPKNGRGEAPQKAQAGASNGFNQERRQGQSQPQTQSQNQSQNQNRGYQQQHVPQNQYQQSQSHGQPHSAGPYERGSYDNYLSARDSNDNSRRGSAPGDYGAPARSQSPYSYGNQTPSNNSKPVAPPNFSAFPKLQNRTSNVPPSDDEREATLENARIPVLSSTDPEMQLTWAQDALSFVDIAAEHEQRVSKFQGKRSSTPQIEHQLRVDAMNIVIFLADQHHPKAEFLRGMWLEFGKFGYREDKPEAFHSYRRAAEKGYTRAEYRIGMQYESTNEPMQALQHYKTGEIMGDSAACYRMGMMSLLGQLGQPQDFQRALHLIRQAAETADENAPQGAYVFGMLQAKELPQIKVPELFLPQDVNSARIYIEKAAYLGFSKAQLKMGSAYELCTLGCDFNPALSMHYNALAARQGEPEAEMAISKWFLCGYENVFHKNEELSYKYAQRAADSKLGMAEFAMGYFHEIGISVPVDLDKALEWYERAASNGNKDAPGRIESIHNSRTLSKKDHENVALSRIKSQHGSMRGARPERFTKPVQTMPTVEDEPVQFPNEARHTPAPPVTSPPPPRPATTINQSIPNRGSSITPYPLDDRPASVAPYPVDDPTGVQPRPRPYGPAGGFLAIDTQQHRPMSATDIRMNPQRGYPPQQQHLTPQPYGRGYNTYGQSYPPRHVSAGNFGGGQSQPPAGGRGQPPPGGRIVSGPPIPSPNYRQPGPAAPPRPSKEMTPQDSQKPTPSQGPAPSQAQSQPAGIDIGFVAPLDVRGAQRNRLQKAPTHNVGQSSGASQDMTSPSSAYSQSPTHPQTGAQQPVRGRTDRPSAKPPQPNSRPSSANPPPSRDPSPKPPQAPAQVPPKPSPKPATATPNYSTPQKHGAPKIDNKPSKPDIKPGKAVNRPPATSSLPGKGPKTFEEMGVPSTKQDSDCIIM